MPDTCTPGSAGKSSIGNQGNFVPQAHTHDQAGGREHLLHSRPAFWAFVADDHNVAGFDLSFEDPFDRFILRVKTDSRTGEYSLTYNSSCFNDGSLLCQVSIENCESADFREWIINGVDNGRIFDLFICDTLIETLTCNRKIVQEDIIPSLTHLVHNGTHAARFVDIFHMNGCQ